MLPLFIIFDVVRDGKRNVESPFILGALFVFDPDAAATFPKSS